MRSLLAAAVGILIGQWLAFGAATSPASLYNLGLAVSPGQSRLAPAGARETVVVLEQARGVWIVPVVLNGSRPARFLVDTGSSVTLVSPLIGAGTVSATGVADTVPLQTLSGLTSGSAGRLASLRIGGVELHDVPVVQHDPGPGIDGILGNSVLARYRLTLDADRKLLYLATAH